jgi:hypothetical protein
LEQGHHLGFTALKIPYRPDNFCAVAAVIEQESSWQGDPTVPNLPAIVWGKIGERPTNTWYRCRW